MRITVGDTVIASINMELDMRDEGMGVILLANVGEVLTIHEITKNKNLWVTSKKHPQAFRCTLSEVSPSLLPS